MKNIRILVNHINERACFDYVDSNRVWSRKNVIIKRIEEGSTEGGKYRIWIFALEEKQNSTTLKTYLAHRILSFYDIETGECFSDTQHYFGHLLNQFTDNKPSGWPHPEENRLRIRNFDLTFDDNGFLYNWHFGVQKAFRPALDIQWTVGKSEDGKNKERFWTRGYPPQYSFDIGDVFYTPKILPERWDTQKRKIDASLRVISMKSKSSDSPGKLLVEWCNYINGEESEPIELELTQSELANLLENGKHEH